jgi:hypothetical protein
LAPCRNWLISCVLMETRRRSRGWRFGKRKDPTWTRASALQLEVGEDGRSKCLARCVLGHRSILRDIRRKLKKKLTEAKPIETKVLCWRETLSYEREIVSSLHSFNLATSDSACSRVSSLDAWGLKPSGSTWRTRERPKTERAVGVAREARRRKRRR